MQNAWDTFFGTSLPAFLVFDETLPSEQMLISCFPVLDESFFSCFQEFLFQQSDYILRHDFVIYFRAYDCADGYINEV